VILSIESPQQGQLGQRTVVLTGGAGYVGSVLARYLVSQGMSVRVIDRCFFGNPFIGEPEVAVLEKDVRQISESDLMGVSDVIDLAAISNDPAGDLDERLTFEINFEARRRLQKLCASSGVERYLLASSCSVYGFNDDVVNEESPLNPLTNYARANALAEESAMALRDSGTVFSAVRQATVYGPSSRMRYDLVVNAMALNVIQGKPLRVLREGTQWRPLVHVSDTSRAMLTILNAPADLVNGQIFNVGSDDQNFTILELATLISTTLGRELNLEWYGAPEYRSYRASFEKIRHTLDFLPQITLEMAVMQIERGLKDGSLEPRPESYTLPWYSKLLTDGHLS
jgi:nucleoside-diphosphate-sugar epimerase